MIKELDPNSFSHPISDKDFNTIVKYAVDNFKGELPNLETAIGILAVGRRFGWKVMYLIHTRKTIARSEKILHIKIRDVLEETSDRTHKSYAWKALQKVSNFWKAVRGEIPGFRTSENQKVE